jgi:hypothetical protein
MLIKKLLKTLLFASLITSTVARANKPSIEHIANPATYHTNVDHLHNDIHNYWYRTPNVVICETSNVTKAQVTDAVNFWKEAGFKIGKVYKEAESNYKCPTNTHDFMYDVIFITHDMQNMGKESWGMTKRFYDWCDELYGSSENHCIKGQGFHSYVLGARIQLADDIQHNSRATTVIAHELGHALGFKHVDDYNDIMTNQPIGRYLPY